ncbi:hypothetical protein Tco_0241992 [Tanacetum coccineum]
MEYLVKFSKRRALWSLNEDILKNTILKTNTPYPARRYGVSVPAFTKDYKGLKPNTSYPEDIHTPYPRYSMKKILEDINRGPYSKLPRYAVKMDNPNITMEEYIRLEEEKARRRGKVYKWETATYGKIWDNEDVHDLRSVETEFPSIVFYDTLTSDATLSCEPTISSLNDEIDFRTSFDESDDEDYMVIFDKNSFSYKMISVNDLKTDSENYNDKVNMPLLPSLEPTVSYFDDLDYFNDFENEFPAIVYNDAQTSKLDFLTEPTLSPQNIDEFDLKEETSLSECNEEDQNNTVLKTNTPYPARRYSVSLSAFTKDYEGLKPNMPYPEDIHTPYPRYSMKKILEDINRGPYSKLPRYAVSNSKDTPRMEAKLFWKKFVVASQPTKKLWISLGKRFERLSFQEQTYSKGVPREPCMTAYLLEELAKQHHDYYYYLVSTNGIQQRAWDPGI